jgi:predicted nucleotidyltransferase
LTIIRAALFGSYARGTSTQTSDIDILVELPEDATLFELGGLKVDLEEKLKKSVDLLTYKTDFSVVLFRSDSMLLAKENHMKVHKNQRLLILPSPPDLPGGAIHQGTYHGVWGADAFAVT